MKENNPPRIDFNYTDPKNEGTFESECDEGKDKIYNSSLGADF